MGAGLTKVVFQPPPRSYEPSHRLIELKTERDEKIPAYFIRKRSGPNDPPAHFTLLFSHGNAEDLGLILGYFVEISDVLGVNFFLYEYSGYGTSTGSPAEENVYADVKAAFQYLRDRLQIPWQQIIPYGRSLGTAPSTYLASITPVRGLILQSPMLSIYRVPFHMRFTLPGDILCNIDRVSKVRCPVMIMHGTRDELVPCWHGHKLYEICKAKGLQSTAYIVQNADHNNLEIQAGDAFYEQLKLFLKGLQDSPPDAALEAQPQLPLSDLQPITRNPAPQGGRPARAAPKAGEAAPAAAAPAAAPAGDQPAPIPV